jgi:hypothetical protein
MPHGDASFPTVSAPPPFSALLDQRQRTRPGAGEVSAVRLEAGKHAFSLKGWWRDDYTLSSRANLLTPTHPGKGHSGSDSNHRLKTIGYNRVLIERRSTSRGLEHRGSKRRGLEHSFNYYYKN